MNHLKLKVFEISNSEQTVTNTHFTLRYRIRRKRIESNFFLSINDKCKQRLLLIERKKFDSVLFFLILHLSVKWVLGIIRRNLFWRLWYANIWKTMNEKLLADKLFESDSRPENGLIICCFSICYAHSLQNFRIVSSLVFVVEIYVLQ